MTPPFLGLPREIRDQIYGLVFSERLKFAPEFFKPKPSLRAKKLSATLLKLSKQGEKQRAYLLDRDKVICDRGPALISTTALAQTNQQIRVEFLEFLSTANVDVVAKVRNFNFGHVIRYLVSIRAKKAEAFEVAVNGRSENVLKIELVGPYDIQAVPNLKDWIELIGAITGHGGELAISHKAIGDSFFLDLNARDSPKTAVQLCEYYRGFTQRPGSIELHKIFITMYARYRAELMLVLSYGRDFLGNNF